MDRPEPRILFVPGFMQRGDAWRAVAERVETSARPVLLDHRRSTLAGRIEEITAAMAPGSVVVGYSMGGRLALHAALRRPHVMSGLVLVGASAGIEDAAVRDERRAADERLASWMERHSIEEIVEAWEALPLFAGQSRELRDRLRPGRLAHDPEELARLLRTAGQGAVPPVWDRLSEIACPALVVAGEADDAYVQAAYRMSERLPHGRARLVAAAGHAPQLEQPEAFARLLREFLEESVPAGLA